MGNNILHNNTSVSNAQRLLYPPPFVKLMAFGLILLLLAGGGAVVYFTGGTHLAYLHLLYLPIILAGILFSIPGGLVIALLSMFILGPLMPSNVDLNLSQPIASWLLRGLFFSGVGILSGIGSSIFRSYITELEEKFTTDSITKLPNLGGLSKIFEEKIAPTNKSVNIMLMEVTHMDEIIQAFGLEGRTTLALQMKERLRGAFTKDIAIGALDPRTFCLLIPDNKDIHHLLPLCKQEMGKPYTINDIPLYVEIHYGISRFPEDGEDMPTLVRKAKVAVSKAQKTGRDQAFFDKEESNRIQRNIKIVHSLHQAIENNLMSLYYQPKLDLKINKPVGFEALARWSHPTLGRIMPGEFIPLTERTLLIHPFTRWVMEESIRQAKQWHDKGFKQTIAVNFSMRNFLDSEIVNTILDKVKKYQFPPEYLEVEVTETAIASNISIATDLMYTLRENGVKIAVDDFGTGLSSLEYLFKLPLDILKIDRCFISAMTSNSGAAAIVRSAITLGHELNLEVVAEGVETAEELEILKKLECDVIQGYLISTPMEGTEATDWLYSKMAGPPSGKVVRTVP